MYGLFLTYSLRENISFKVDFIGALIILLGYYGIRFLFFDSLLQFHGNLGGFTHNDISLLLMISLLSGRVVFAFADSIHRFFALTQRGAIEPLLTKPIHTQKILLFRWIKTSNLLVFFLLLIVFCVFNPVVFHVPLITLVGAIFLFILGVIAQLSFIIFLETLSLALHRLIPVDFMFSELNELTVLPISLFNRKVLKFLIVFLPAIVSHGILVDFIKYGMSWKNLLFTVCVFVWGLGSTVFFSYQMNHFDGHGG